MGLSPNGQGPKRNGRPTKDNKCTKTYTNRGLKCPQSKYKKLVLSKVATNEGKHQEHDQKREQVVTMDPTRRKRPQRHSPKPAHQPRNHTTRVEFPRRNLERQVSFFFCFEAGIQGGVQCKGTHFTTKNTDTRPHH